MDRTGGAHALSSGRGRVLFLYTTAGRGGDAVQVLSMAEALRRLGFSVTLAGPQRLRPYCFSGPASTARGLAKRLPWWVRDIAELGLNIMMFARAALIALRLRPDYILERVTPYGPAGVWLSRFLNVPLVAHLDAPFEVERAFRKESMFSSLHRGAVRRLGRCARLVVVGSQFSRRYYHSLGVPKSVMVVMRNGVFPEDIVPTPTRFQGQPVIGFVGSMAAWHRVDLLLEAVADLRRTGCDCRLLLIGTGESYPTLVEHAAQLGLADAVEFTGPVDRAQALRLLDQCTVAVLPHSLSTGSPMKLVEYAARAVPIVAPDLPNIREMWGSTVAYFTAQDSRALSETLRSLIKDERWRALLARAAWRRARQLYTWERQMAEVISSLGNGGAA
ncbi:MAG TPA: hypothetical protein DGR79_07425 [Clostridiales bacterium]|nr:hypothetical protein [Clostridiales bacterium]